MSKRIYVGNLPFSSGSDDVRDLFEQYGKVTEVHLVTDRNTGQPRGFGFVEMEDDEAAETAISNLNDKEFQGRNLKVNVARPRENRGGGGRGGYGGGSGDRW
jgi:RNA recognition motif-containing protein